MVIEKFHRKLVTGLPLIHDGQGQDVVWCKWNRFYEPKIVAEPEKNYAVSVSHVCHKSKIEEV